MTETKLKVLLIEDDETDYIGLQRAFKTLAIDCDLHLAKSGEDGWKDLVAIASSSHKLPVVLLDINLPGQSGLETLQLIRTSPLTKDTRVIVWSNIRDQNEVDAANDLDIEGFLLKSTTGSPTLGTCYVKAATMLNEYWRIH